MAQADVSRRKSSRKSSRYKIPVEAPGIYHREERGAWGTKDDRTVISNTTHSPILLRVRRNPEQTDFQMFSREVAERQDPKLSKTKPSYSTVVKETFVRKDYDTSNKVLPLTQASDHELTPQKVQLNDPERSVLEAAQPRSPVTSPVTFLNSTISREQTDDAFQNPAESVSNISFLEIDDIGAIEPNLPSYSKTASVPVKPYNGIDPTSFTRTIEGAYEEIVKWRKNAFLVPSGKNGKTFIKLLIDWMDKFNQDTTFQGIALKVIMCLPGLMLQKPSAKSKTKEHTKLLEERLKLWDEGKISEILKEGKTIQKKLTKSKRTPNDISRIFSKLMLEGKVGAALKFLEENVENSVLAPSPKVLEKLKKLHPLPSEIQPGILQHGPIQETPDAYFYSITEDTILKAANKTKGSGGPSQFDAKQWRRILCSNQFKAESKELREEVARFARKISTRVLDPDSLQTYVASRLIPVNKNPSETDPNAEPQVRPIGVGEVLRRIVGKALSWTLHDDIQDAAGSLQVSTGLRGGSEAAIHAMSDIFSLESTDAVILVDAENAFNRLNRLVALHNMFYACPPFATVLVNTYRIPSRLFIPDGGELLSNEGTTQGDTLAMSFYGISIIPILRLLKEKVPGVAQVWLADDATGAGKLSDLRHWWDLICMEGKKYGYFVKPSKSWLILKDLSKLKETETAFQGSQVQITTTGMRHLGAALGSDDFKKEYMEEKVNTWCGEIRKLSEIAKTQPHAAYAAYTHGEQHKFTYFLRTIPDISEMLQPLDEVIDSMFLPALFGREISETERDLMSIPVNEGGLGIRKVSSVANTAYQTSREVTKPLTTQIKTQDEQLPNKEEALRTKKAALEAANIQNTIEKTRIKENQPPEVRRLVEQASEPGTSSWLTALPLQEYGFNLNKNEFQDALCLRFNKPLKNLPTKCPCGSDFNITHALNCHRGGFVNARHDSIRDMEYNLLKVVCNDVEVEPQLQEVTGLNFHRSANTRDDARLDIRARGFWRQGQNAFFDVRVVVVMGIFG